jgi:hypothetical protein
MALTDKEIQALKPADKRYKVTDGDGLYLLVNPAGGKYWYMKYFFGLPPAGGGVRRLSCNKPKARPRETPRRKATAGEGFKSET